MVAAIAPVSPVGPSRVRLAVVGELENVDARPADVTVTGVLRLSDGTELTRNNARDLMVHKLLPGERTPFVVVYDGVTEGVDVKIDPRQVSSFDVFAKAVVTGRDLDRDLATWSVPREREVALSLVNVGTAEATVPHALLALYDRRGVQWVDGAYSLEAVPPRQTRDLNVPTSLPAGYRVLSMGESRPDAVRGRFALPDGRSYTLTVHEFERETK